MKFWSVFQEERMRFKLLAILIGLVIVLGLKFCLPKSLNKADASFYPADHVGQYTCFDTAENIEEIYRRFSPDGGWSDILGSNLLIREVKCESFEKYSYCCFYKTNAISELDK
jgi:hypothetical protein